MEFQKGDIWVGLFVVLSLAVLVVTLLALAQGRFGDTYTLTARFDSISSIKPGTPVLLRGYQVGEVKAVRFVPLPQIHFDADLVVKRDIHLLAGTRAVIASTNLIGDNYLDLDISQAFGEPLEPGAVIPGGASQAMGELMGKVNGILESVRTTVQTLGLTLGAETPGGAAAGPGTVTRVPLAELTQATVALRDLLVTLEALANETRPEIAATGEETRAELRQAQWTTAQAGSLLVENRAKIGELVTHLDETTQSLNALLGELHGMAAENREEIAGTIAELEKTSANLTRLTDEVARHPWKLLFR